MIHITIKVMETEEGVARRTTIEKFDTSCAEIAGAIGVILATDAIADEDFNLETTIREIMENEEVPNLIELLKQLDDGFQAVLG